MRAGVLVGEKQCQTNDIQLITTFVDMVNETQLDRKSKLQLFYSTWLSPVTKLIWKYEEWDQGTTIECRQSDTLTSQKWYLKMDIF